MLLRCVIVGSLACDCNRRKATKHLRCIQKHTHGGEDEKKFATWIEKSGALEKYVRLR